MTFLSNQFETTRSQKKNPLSKHLRRDKQSVYSRVYQEALGRTRTLLSIGQKGISHPRKINSGQGWYQSTPWSQGGNWLSWKLYMKAKDFSHCYNCIEHLVLTLFWRPNLPLCHFFPLLKTNTTRQFKIFIISPQLYISYSFPWSLQHLNQKPMFWHSVNLQISKNMYIFRVHRDTMHSEWLLEIYRDRWQKKRHYSV